MEATKCTYVVYKGFDDDDNVDTLFSKDKVQFSSFQSLDRLHRRGDTRDDSAEILF